MNKAIDWGNLAPRLGVAWDITGNAKNVLRAGYGKSFFPVAQSASNLLGQQVPYTISQNYSVETNPLDYSPARVPQLSNPFSAIVQVKPTTTEELNAANPRVLGHSFSNETPNMQTWQVSYDRQITNTLMAEAAYVGSSPASGRKPRGGSSSRSPTSPTSSSATPPAVRPTTACRARS